MYSLNQTGPPEIQASIACKNCGSHAVVKYGKYRQQQMYWCKSCCKKFKGDSSSYHMKTPCNEICRFLKLFYCGSGIKDIIRSLEAEFGRAPAKRTLFNWLNKYSGLAVSANQHYIPPVTGDVWIADETVIRIAGQKVRIFDIQDEKTKCLLATHISLWDSAAEPRLFLQQAYQYAGRMPATVITDSYISYLIEADSYSDAGHWQIPVDLFSLETDAQRIVPFHATLRDRTTVVKRMKSIASARLFNRSWLIYYNFFRPHEALNGKTPSEQAGIEPACRSWEDVVLNPSSPLRGAE